MDTAPKANHIYLQLLEFIRNNKPCVLATVTGTQGSTPQKPGSSAIFDKKKLVAGTVGGGAVELAIGEIAAEAILSKKSGYFHFDLDNDISDIESAICGGGMKILVDAAPEKHIEVFEEIRISGINRIPGVLVILCGSGLSNCDGIKRFWLTSDNLAKFSEKMPDEIIVAATEMLDNSNADEFR